LICTSNNVNISVVDFLLFKRHLWKCWCVFICNPVCCGCHKCC